MKLTTTFEKILDTYKSKQRFIISKGSSRSSKTYSTLQLFYLICKQSKKRRVIHVVSYATPHLVDGAIADFDNILTLAGENLDRIKVKNPHTYTIGNSIVKFIGFDKAGRALGAQRDILFVNEANNMKHEVVSQLFIRTSEAVFIDYNPSISFWLDKEGYDKRADATVLHSTFLDNLENISESQILEFAEWKRKHDEEVKKGIKGFWFNKWRVYGLGVAGQVEGTIINNWRTGDFPESADYIYGLDWGYRDPFTLIKVARQGGKLFVQQVVYKSELSNNEIINLLKANVEKNKLILADSADQTMIRSCMQEGFNIMPCLSKDKVAVGVRQLSAYDEIIVTPESTDIIEELNSYIWLDKSGEVPIDKYNHSIDAIRYAEKFIRLSKR